MVNVHSQGGVEYSSDTALAASWRDMIWRMYSLVDHVGVLEMFTSCSGTSEVKETM